MTRDVYFEMQINNQPTGMIENLSNISLTVTALEIFRLSYVCKRINL